MARNLAFKFTALGGVCLTGFFAGSYVERKNVMARLQRTLNTDANILESIIQPGKTITLPGSHIIGTVSAATPVPASELIASGPKRVSQIMKFGFPGLDNVRSFDDYVLSYDQKHRVPHWVLEHMTKETIKSNDSIDRSKCDFTPDPSIHVFFRSQNTDYKGSGFDRGHMAAAGNHKLDQKHVDQTFFLTNMAPQVGVGFNRHIWNKLEKHVRKLTRIYSNVYCCTGPLYLPKKESDGKMYVKYQVLGANTVAVPTHFYKVVVAETPDGHLDLEAYCMPNQAIPDETPLTNFQVPPETIERAAGLIFFNKIDRSQFSKINGRKR